MTNADLFESQLGAGESIVWSGRGSDKLLIRTDYFFVLGGAFLGVIALSAFVASVLAVFNGDGAAAFVGLVFSIVVGTLALFLIFGRLIRRYRRTKRKSYAITDRRAIELTSRDGTQATPSKKTVNFSDEPTTNLSNHFERRGTITVGSIKFENIEDAAVVYELLCAELAKRSRD